MLAFSFDSVAENSIISVQFSAANHAASADSTNKPKSVPAEVDPSSGGEAGETRHGSICFPTHLCPTPPP